MKFGRTKLTAIMAISGAILAGVFSAMGFYRLAVPLLAITMGLTVVILLVNHEYLVKRIHRDLRGISKANSNHVPSFPSQIEDSNSHSLGHGSKKELPKSSRLESSPEEVPTLPLGNLLEYHHFQGGIGPKFEFAVRTTRSKGRLETFALRTQSINVREAFARAATNLHYDVEDVLKAFRSQRAGMLPGVQATRSWNPEHLLSLARVLTNQRHSNDDIDDAEVIYNQLVKAYGFKILGKTDIYVYAEVLEELGRYSDIEKLIKATKLARKDPVHVALLRANRVSNGTEQDLNRWLNQLNELFQKHGFSSIDLESPYTETLFDSVTGTIQPRSVDGPTISVIIPTHNGADFINTALNSLAQQTWKNLEFIVVDDGSSEENFGKLQQICETYPEVTLIRQEKNLGAYPARNYALEFARGDYITVHDDDDWSHPEKIETQIRFLLENPDVPANMSRHVRTTETLRFNRINNNPSFSQPNFSSLMFRKEIVDQVGVWDNVSRGADAEFKDRIVAATGKQVPVVSKVPLSFTRTHAASLTAGEIGRGYIDPSRLFYQSSYQNSHSSALNTKNWKNQSFARPLNMKPGMSGKHLGEFDVVFVTDFVFPGGTSSLTLNEIEAAAAAGLRAGMINMFSPVNAGISSITDRALQVANLQGVTVLSLKDEASVATMVVRHPSVLQYADQMSSSLQVGRVEIIVNNPVVMAGGIAYGFDLKIVKANAIRLFGDNVTIYAETAVTQKQTKVMARRSELSDQVWPGFVKDYFAKEHKVNKRRKPVIGRHSRNSPNKWPSKLSVYQLVYSKNKVYSDIRILGGISTVPGWGQRILKQNAHVYEFNEIEVADFLQDLDFWVYFHGDEWIESFGMAIVEALSAGLVVILPPYMEVNFGEGALYAKPSEVKALIAEYWADPAKYAAQSHAARRVAAERYSEQAFQKRLNQLVESGRDALSMDEPSSRHG